MLVAALDSPAAERLLVAALDSPAAERLLVRVLESSLIDEAVQRLLEGEELWLVVERDRAEPRGDGGDHEAEHRLRRPGRGRGARPVAQRRRLAGARREACAQASPAGPPPEAP